MSVQIKQLEHWYFILYVISAKIIVVILRDITWTEQIVKAVVHMACIQEIPGVNFGCATNS
jgi:predicted phosphohydrolase